MAFIRARALAERDERCQINTYIIIRSLYTYTRDARRERASLQACHAMPPRKVKTGQEDPRHKKVNTAYVAAC